MLDTYVPPFSIEAEQSVLGAMLIDKMAIVETMQQLKEDDFYNPKHSEMYQAIINLANEDKPVDIITLNNQGFDLEYLSNIVSLVPTTTNIKHYCGIVKGKSIRRQYIKQAQEVIELAYNGEYDNIVDFKSDVQQKMDIEIKDEKQQEAHIRPILNRVMLNINDRYETKETAYKKYGYKWLDDKMGGIKNSLTYLAARPSVGKSAFAFNVALNLLYQKMSVAIFNLEMEQEQIVERLISASEGIQQEKISKPWLLKDSDWGKLQKGLNLMNFDCHIYDNVFKVEEMRAICRQLNQKGKLDYVIVDYLQLCETMKKCNNTNDRVSHISRQFKLMQKEFKVPFLVLSQLSRDNAKDNRRPKLTDLRDSGSLEQDADNVWFLHDESYGQYDNNEKEHSEIELIIAKQRAGERDIMTELKFYKKTQKFID